MHSVAQVCRTFGPPEYRHACLGRTQRQTRA
jgi:hypothetical protein